MTRDTPASDEVRRFIMENHPVRGHWVRLGDAWRELRAHRDYPQPVRDLLGQAVAASVLLAATLKFRGTLTLQMQGDGAVSLLVAQCTHDYRIRGVARFDEKMVEDMVAACAHDGAAEEKLTFRRLVGTDSRIVVTVEAQERTARYQGVVPLTGDSLEASLEAYFATSEQLPTRLRLAADDEHGAGVLVQRLPASVVGGADETQNQAAWEAAARGIERLSPAELLESSVEQLLERGFATHDIRLFDGSPVQFECRCSEEHVAEMLRALGAEEVREVLEEQGDITVTCEFCHRPYRFDAIDVEALFAPGSGGPSSHSVH